MASQRIIKSQKVSNQFSQNFCVVIGLRLFLDGHLSGRNVDDFLKVVGDYLKWPKVLINELRTLVHAGKSKNYLDQIDDVQFVEEVCIGQGNRDEFSLDDAFRELVKSHRSIVHQMLRRSLESSEKELAKTEDELRRNINILRGLVGLNELETQILIVAALNSLNKHFSQVLRCIEIGAKREGIDTLATALGCSPIDLSFALRNEERLLEFGLIEIDSSPRDLDDFLKVTDVIGQCLGQPNNTITEMMRHFVDVSTTGTLMLGDYPHIAEDIGYITKLLNGAINSRAHGINILLHGIPGTGKTELAKSLSQELGITLFEVTSKDSNGDGANRHERLTSLKLAQRFLAENKSSLVMLDEAEDIFEHSGTSFFSRMFGGRSSRKSSSDSKAWVNQLLENNPVPVIWISNAIDQIDPAALRRFTYILEVRNPPMQVRRRIAEKHLGALSVSEQFLDKIAEQSNVVPALLQNAAKVVGLAGVPTDEVEPLASRVIELSLEAMGEKTTNTVLRPSVTSYRLDYLNIESKYSIEKILASLKVRSKSTMCFYGLPGTGKTALAEHVARTLDKPLIARRTSELMSMWVGQTEKQIAAMFREAENEKAVLFLDEADSFLSDRQHARQSWEVTQVNELLQQMERFTGIFICATNLFENLDAAALRRFTFKLKFHALTLEQRKGMFIQEALEGDATQLSPSMESRLRRMDNLTPGDFATVKRQAELLGELPTPEDFLSELECELAAKNREEHRPIGFQA